MYLVLIHNHASPFLHVSPPVPQPLEHNREHQTLLDPFTPIQLLFFPLHDSIFHSTTNTVFDTWDTWTTERAFLDYPYRSFLPVVSILQLSYELNVYSRAYCSKPIFRLLNTLSELRWTGARSSPLLSIALAQFSCCICCTILMLCCGDKHTERTMVLVMLEANYALVFPRELYMNYARRNVLGAHYA